MSSEINTVISAQGDTVSSIAYRVYGTSKGKVEQILELNPGLCAHPALLGAGIEITLPAEHKGSISRPPAVNLWD